VRTKCDETCEKVENCPTTSDAQNELNKLQRLNQRCHQIDLKNLVKEIFEKAKEKFENRTKEREKEFTEILHQWDIPRLEQFFKNISNDKILTETCSIQMKDQINKIFVSLDQTDPAEISIIFEKLFLIIKISKSFPHVTNQNSILKQQERMKKFVQSQTQKVFSILESVIHSDEIPQLSLLIRLLLEIKSFEKEGLVFIQEKEFSNILNQICTLFGNNRDNLESALARIEFKRIYDTLIVIEMLDPLMSDVTNFFSEESRGKHFSLLVTTLNNCPNYQKSKQKISIWLNNLPETLQKQWDKKEFNSILKFLQGFQSGNASYLQKTFPDINTILTNAQQTVATLYENLSKSTSNSFDQQNWKQFREGFSLLTSISEIEALLNKNSQVMLKEIVLDKIKNISNIDTETGSEDDVVQSLVELNQMGQNIPNFNDQIILHSNRLINNYAKNGEDSVYLLGMKLDTMSGPMAKYGKDVVSSFKVFSAVSLQVWQEKTKTQDFDWALGDDPDSHQPRFLFTETYPDSKKASAMWVWDTCVKFCKEATGNNIKNTWKTMYTEFTTEFQKLYDDSLTKGLDFIIQNTLNLFKNPSTIARKLPSALAHICVVWSRKKSVVSSQGKTFRLRPHPVQILCFFRLLESDKGLYMNQLIEVLTGEGKSVVLGVVATFFGLLRYNVNSICYSKYLSSRDYADFLEVFEAFNIHNNIVYSTISEMCEIMINREGNVRDLTKSVIDSAASNKSYNQTYPPSKSILLIDEVDVFFGADFYGNTYNPATLLSNPLTYEILKFIYGNRASVNFQAVAQLTSYLQLTKTFSKIKLLIDFEIRKMLKEVETFENTPEKPIVNKDIIYYKDNDTVTCKKVYGYKTAFQYLHKFSNGEIKDEQNVKDHVGIYIGCGNFSFAEIPKDFNIIMGVSGTLRSLTNEEREIIQSYGIQRLAFAPSIYGGSRLNQKATIPKKSSITMLNEKSQWFVKIVQHSQEKQQAGRAVLIFFENITILNEFHTSNISSLQECHILEENEEFKETIIKQSTTSGFVTLCTRPFGRGVDFICRDPKTKGADGVHIIQTFVAASEAEQIQIKGRAARQGDPGSHEYLLFYGDLIKYLGTTEGQPQNSGFDSFEFDSKLSLEELEKKLTKLRDTLYETEVKELRSRKDEALKAHNNTKLYHKELTNYDGSVESREKITDFLMKLNQAAVSQAVAKYHLFFCLDESGSMSGSPWDELINAVDAFIQKRIEMCDSNGCPVEDLVTVVNYGSSARVVFQNKAIQKVRPRSHIDYAGGGTDFACGLKTVGQCLSSSNLTGYTPCLLFMSDGGSSNGEAEMSDLHQKFPAMKVFVIGFSSGCDRHKMTNMATLGGGQFFFGADGTQLKGEFEAISVSISGGAMAL